MSENHQVLIASVPEGPLRTEHFEVKASAVPTPGDGQVLCRTIALTIGAGQRAGLQGSASYAGAPQSGVVMSGTGVAKVAASKSSKLRAGDLVVGPTGWQDYSVHDVGHLQKVEPGTDPAFQLGALGTNGLTAYFGLLRIGFPRKEETVVVSAAAGSVGHIAGQIAKIQGCRVVGVAGSDQKCEMLTNELGFDAAVNYKREDFRAAFKAATPDRIDVYFDNTGGEILGSALFRMNTHGRIVCCGVVSQYDTANPEPGPRGVPGLLVNNRVRMEGFLVFDFLNEYDNARVQLRAWADEGVLQLKMTEYDGLARAPQAFVDLLGGRTVGTTLVRVAQG